MTPSWSILTEEFADAAAKAGAQARQRALASGHSVVFLDEAGQYVEEEPDGKRFEVRFLPGAPRDLHLVTIGELPTTHAE